MRTADFKDQGHKIGRLAKTLEPTPNMPCAEADRWLIEAGSDEVDRLRIREVAPVTTERICRVDGIPANGKFAHPRPRRAIRSFSSRRSMSAQLALRYEAALRESASHMSRDPWAPFATPIE